jgi:hypothetical protein
MAKPTYSEKLKDPRWQKKRLEIFERDKWKCQSCGGKTNTLQVHHRYYQRGCNPWDYPDECYQTLCEQCHKLAGDNIERFDEVFKTFFSHECLAELAERVLSTSPEHAWELALSFMEVLGDHHLREYLIRRSGRSLQTPEPTEIPPAPPALTIPREDIPQEPFPKPTGPHAELWADALSRCRLVSPFAFAYLAMANLTKIEGHFCWVTWPITAIDSFDLANNQKNKTLVVVKLIEAGVPYLKEAKFCVEGEDK